MRIPSGEQAVGTPRSVSTATGPANVHARSRRARAGTGPPRRRRAPVRRRRLGAARAQRDAGPVDDAVGQRDRERGQVGPDRAQVAQRRGQPQRPRARLRPTRVRPAAGFMVTPVSVSAARPAAGDQVPGQVAAGEFHARARQADRQVALDHGREPGRRDDPPPAHRRARRSSRRARRAGRWSAAGSRRRAPGRRAGSRAAASAAVTAASRSATTTWPGRVRAAGRVDDDHRARAVVGLGRARQRADAAGGRPVERGPDGPGDRRPDGDHAAGRVDQDLLGRRRGPAAGRQAGQPDRRPRQRRAVDGQREQRRAVRSGAGERMAGAELPDRAVGDLVWRRAPRSAARSRAAAGRRARAAGAWPAACRAGARPRRRWRSPAVAGRRYSGAGSPSGCSANRPACRQRAHLRGVVAVDLPREDGRGGRGRVVRAAGRDAAPRRVELACRPAGARPRASTGSPCGAPGGCSCWHHTVVCQPSVARAGQPVTTEAKSSSADGVPAPPAQRRGRADLGPSRVRRQAEQLGRGRAAPSRRRCRGRRRRVPGPRRRPAAATAPRSRRAAPARPGCRPAAGRPAGRAAAWRGSWRDGSAIRAHPQVDARDVEQLVRAARAVGRATGPPRRPAQAAPVSVRFGDADHAGDRLGDLR